MTKYEFQDFLYVDEKLYIQSTEEDYWKKEEKYFAKEDYWSKRSSMDKFSLMVHLEWMKLLAL